MFEGSVILPMWMVIGGFLAMWFPLVYCAKRIFWDDKRYCPERSVLIDCRKKNLPVIGLIDIGSNNATLEAGNKKKSDDIAFDSQHAGIRIDPILTSVGCEPVRVNGLDYYWYAFENWLPQTVTNHLAYKAIIEFKNTFCEDLAFLTDIEFISLISTPETHLAHDVQMYISKYFKNVKMVDPVTRKEIYKNVRQFEAEDPTTCVIGNDGLPIPGTGQIVKYEQEINIVDIVNRIESIKGEVAKLPISRGYFSMTEAFKHNAYAYSAQDLEMLLIIHDKQQMADWMKRFNMQQYALAAAVILVAGGIAFYIVTQAVKMMG